MSQLPVATRLLTGSDGGLGEGAAHSSHVFPEWHHHWCVPRESLQLAYRGGGCDIIHAYQSGPLPGHDCKDQSDPRHHVSNPPPTLHLEEDGGTSVDCPRSGLSAYDAVAVLPHASSLLS